MTPFFPIARSAAPASTFLLSGLDCANCAKSVETGVAKLEGVTHCDVIFGAMRLNVEGTVPREAVIARVRALGYDVREQTDSAPATPQTRHFLGYLLQRRDTALALLGALLILPGLFAQELLPFLSAALTRILPIAPALISACSLAALLVAGLPIARSAWRALAINREININVLMTMAAIGAVFIGAYTEAGLVMVLFAIGEALEGYTGLRARESIRALLQIAPNTAILLGSDDREIETPITALTIEDRILIKPGAGVPLDGHILQGASALNQAAITGESMPVDKTEGDAVFAGSINGEGALIVRVTSTASDNTLSRIIAMVEDAQMRKAPAERFVDAFAKIYTPAVALLAVFVAALPPLFFNQPFWGEQGWLYRALELLVIACPCALVISTPVAIISAVSNAARNGILIKGGAALEALARVNAIAFDKTGTLTRGAPDVVQVRAASCAMHDAAATCADCDDLLALAGALERRSEHPLAKAVVLNAQRRAVLDRFPAADTVRAQTGIGVSGRVGTHEVQVASHRHFDLAITHDSAVCAAATDAAARGHTPLMVARDGVYAGTITVADTVRESSAAAISALHDSGVAHTIMLTGDNAGAAQHIAKSVGVRELRAELLPEHKVSAVQELRERYGSVAMVGDGINDTPALAAATLGIAMGGGTAQAAETADITLMGNDLRQLAYARTLALRALRTIRLNIALAIGVKLAFLALVVAGFGTLWLAVLADVGTTLVVTALGARLARTSR